VVTEAGKAALAARRRREVHQSTQRGGKVTAVATAATDPATSLQNRTADPEGGHAQAQTDTSSAHRQFRISSRELENAIATSFGR